MVIKNGTEITRTQRNAGRAMMVAAAILWGLAGVCVKSITWGSLSVMCVRSIISLVMLLAVRRSVKVKLNKTNVIGAVMLSATGILYIEAIKLTTAGTAIVLQYVAPILVFLYSVVFQKRKARLSEALITVAVFAGCALSFADALDATKIAGNLLGLLSGFTFAGQIIAMSAGDADSESSMLIGCAVSSVICFPFLFFDPGLSFDAKNILWILILGVFQYGLANIMFSKGIRYVDKVEGSLILTIEPIFNPIPVAVICGETMGSKAIIGSIIVIIFVTLYGLLPSRQAKE